MGRFPIFELGGLRPLFVELYPQPRRVGDQIARPVLHRLHRKPVGIVAHPGFRGGGAHFQPGEVGHGRGQMDRRRGADRAEGIVGHQIDVVGLGHGRHLHRLGQPAHIADIDPGVVGDAPFDVRQELPLAGELLADGERDGRHCAQTLVGFRRLVPDGFFHPV